MEQVPGSRSAALASRDGRQRAGWCEFVVLLQGMVSGSFVSMLFSR